MLSGEMEVARLDEERDSGAIVRLVEQLRQAILIYQVGTVEGHRSCGVDEFSIVVAKTVCR